MRKGPQPYEGAVSVVCETFGCTPDVAAMQSWPLVQAILDYRGVERAVALVNAGNTGFEELKTQPHLQQLLLELQRSRTPGVELGEVMTAAAGIAQRAQKAQEAED